MLADRPPLTARQLTVLRWIADGCPDGVWPDHSHKLLVGRLETLNLASVRRRHGRWHAVLQPDGDYYLRHGRHRGASPNDLPGPSASAVTGHAAASTSATAAASRVRAKELSPTEQLVAQIVAAGGTLTLTPDDAGGHRRLELQVHAAQRHGKAPEGTQLVVERPRWSTFVVKLVPLPAWMAEPVAEVTVPTQLRQPHEAVAALRDNDHLLAIGGAPRRRALLLLQGLVTAALQRGHTVAVGAVTDRGRRRQPTRTHLLFAVAGHQVGVRVVQLSDRTEHVPTARELADSQRYSFSSIPRYDHTPGDRLKIEVTAHGGAGSWADGVRTKLEDRLADVLRAIERAAVAAERARVAAEERRRKELLEQERRVAHATRRLVEANRAQVLDEQLAAWSRARELEDYVAAMTAVVEQIDDPEDGVAAAEWLDWVRQHARAIDPLTGRIEMPADPEPTHAALAPFLQRPSYRW